MLDMLVHAADRLSFLGSAYMTLPFVMAVLYKEARFFMWGSAVIVAATTTSIIKHVTRDSPTRALKRPEGARNCNAWNDDGDQSGQPGFPSGHAATAAAFWFHAWCMAPSAWRPWIAGAGLTATGIMGWARWAKHCHTVLQIVGGIGVGIGVSWMFC